MIVDCSSSVNWAGNPSAGNEAIVSSNISFTTRYLRVPFVVVNALPLWLEPVFILFIVWTKKIVGCVSAKVVNSARELDESQL